VSQCEIIQYATSTKAHPSGRLSHKISNHLQLAHWQNKPMVPETSPTPHCRVLPPGEFNGMIPIPLSIYRESFITISCNRFFSYCNVNKYRNDEINTRPKTTPRRLLPAPGGGKIALKKDSFRTRLRYVMLTFRQTAHSSLNRDCTSKPSCWTAGSVTADTVRRASDVDRIE